MRMSDCETVDDILTEFAKRDPAGYVVWGQKIGRAYHEEAKNRENESRAANNLNDALNIEVKRLTADNAALRDLVKELAEIVDGPLCHQDCAKCPPDTRCASKRLRALVAKAREVCNG